MKMILRKASDDTVQKVEVNTIEDLIALSELYENPIIIGKWISDEDNFSLLLYDDYIE